MEKFCNKIFNNINIDFNKFENQCRNEMERYIIDNQSNMIIEFMEELEELLAELDINRY